MAIQQHHNPYDVACELANQDNSLTALLMAAMMKADGPALRTLSNAFPNVHLRMIEASARSKRREGK